MRGNALEVHETITVQRSSHAYFLCMQGPGITKTLATPLVGGGNLDKLRDSSG